MTPQTRQKLIFSICTHPYFMILNILLALTPLKLRYIFSIDCLLFYVLYLTNPQMFSCM